MKATSCSSTRVEESLSKRVVLGFRTVLVQRPLVAHAVAVPRLGQSNRGFLCFAGGTDSLKKAASSSVGGPWGAGVTAAARKRSSKAAGASPTVGTPISYPPTTRSLTVSMYVRAAAPTASWRAATALR